MKDSFGNKLSKTEETEVWKSRCSQSWGYGFFVGFTLAFLLIIIEGIWDLIF